MRTNGESISDYSGMFCCPDCLVSCEATSQSLICRSCDREYTLQHGVLSALPSDNAVDPAAKKLKEESYHYWDGGIPGTVEGGYQEGRVTSTPLSREWFEEGDKQRYDDYTRIKEFCEFEEFQGKKILDIGPGRGQETHGYVSVNAEVTTRLCDARGANYTGEIPKV